MAVNPNCIDTGLTDILKSDLKKWRKTVGTELDTIAVARTDIEGLESEVFQGASPEVIKAAPKEAGLKPLDEEMPDRIIKAPFEGKKSQRFTRHAEEMVINKFINAVDKKYQNPQDVKGKLYIHQSNNGGVCSNCKSGFGRNPMPLKVYYIN
ncbi:MAG: hypothetical protein WB502_15490 [Thermoactinomyces sp.]